MITVFTTCFLFSFAILARSLSVCLSVKKQNDQLSVGKEFVHFLPIAFPGKTSTESSSRRGESNACDAVAAGANLPREFLSAFSPLGVALSYSINFARRRRRCTGESERRGRGGGAGRIKLDVILDPCQVGVLSNYCHPPFCAGGSRGGAVFLPPCTPPARRETSSASSSAFPVLRNLLGLFSPGDGFSPWPFECSFRRSPFPATQLLYQSN